MVRYVLFLNFQGYWTMGGAFFWGEVADIVLSA